MNALQKEDYKQIILNSNISVLHQIKSLLKTEGITLEFTEAAVDTISDIVYELNHTQEDTGARRITSVINHILDDLNFDAPEIYDKYHQKGMEMIITLDDEFIKMKCKDILKDTKNYKKYIL